MQLIVFFTLLVEEWIREHTIDTNEGLNVLENEISNANKRIY